MSGGVESWRICATIILQSLFMGDAMALEKNAVVRARTNEALKHDVEDILDSLGLSMTDAINLMLCQIKLNNGLPFDVKIPNKETRKVCEESAAGKNVKSFSSAEDLFNDLGI